MDSLEFSQSQLAFAFANLDVCSFAFSLLNCSAMLDGSSDSRDLCIVPELEGKLSVFELSLSIMLAVSFSYVTLILLRLYLCILN